MTPIYSSPFLSTWYVYSIQLLHLEFQAEFLQIYVKILNNSKSILTLFLPALGGISPYMSVTWQQPVEIGLNDQEVHSDLFRINLESFRTFRDLVFYQQITWKEPILKAWYMLLTLGDLKNPFVCLKFMQGMINEQAYFRYTYLPALIFQLCMTNERNTSTPCSFHHLVALILKGRDG